jgi:hypothetical protein
MQKVLLIGNLGRDPEVGGNPVWAPPFRQPTTWRDYSSHLIDDPRCSSFETTKASLCSARSLTGPKLARGPCTSPTRTETTVENVIV